jgi:hypothetical protein
MEMFDANANRLYLQRVKQNLNLLLTSALLTSAAVGF